MPVLPFLSPRSIALSTNTDSLELRSSSLSDTARMLLQRLPAKLQPRQQDTQNGILAIPTQYQDLNGRSPGVVVLIVLASVAGFLLLIWLLWIASNGTGFIQTSGFIEEEATIVHTPRSHRSRRTEMVSRSPTRRVIRTERIVRDSVPPPQRERSRVRETILVEEDDDGYPPPINPERRVPGDDVIEVMEEHTSVGTPPPRRESRRSRRSSGVYRS